MNEDTPQNESASNLTEYFFAGGGEYVPMTILAASIEEATAEYEVRRVAVDEETLQVENIEE